jgi:putative transposase
VVRELIAKIERFTEACNVTARPFGWTLTADSILAGLERPCERISCERRPVTDPWY